MRRASPHELTTRAVPVLTARVTEAELEKWLPVAFDDIDDPLAAAEPSKGALIELTSGAFVVVYYGKDSNQLTLEIPESSEASELLASFLDEVPLPISRVLWHRADMKLPARRRSARRVTMPAKR